MRLCDGYTFPVGVYRGYGDKAAHEATCRGECPNAATALYIMPAGSDSIDDAVGASSRASYKKLPAAFKFRTSLDPACTCHPPGGGRRVSLLRDYTLRRGDVVMTVSGLKVFHGGSFPFKPAAFSPLLRSRDVPRQNLAVFQAINRARLKADQSVRVELPGRELTVTHKRQEKKKQGTEKPEPMTNERQVKR